MTTNYPNGLSSFGLPLTGSLANIFSTLGMGRIIFVNPNTGTDGNDGLDMQSAVETIERAYEIAQTGDTIALSTGTTHSLTTGLDFTKSRINVVGLDWPGRFLQQGAKVQLSGNVASAYVIKNTGVRNAFVNIKFIQASTNAAALTVMQEGGEGTLWEGCSFTFGVANNLDETTASEVVAGSDSATYRDCTFGSDTLLTSAARTVFLIDQVNGFEFKSNQLHNCTFSISSSSATAKFVSLAAVTDILFSNLFKECTFYASVDSAGGAALTVASFTGTGTNKGTLAYDRCSFFNVGDVATATSGGNAATQIVAVSPTAGTAGIGVAPTA